MKIESKPDFHPKIFIACHKSYQFPKDNLYQPIEVGAAQRSDLSPGVLRDDFGENISEKNQNYCELTGLYWLWKNINGYQSIGYVHYRRYFGKKRGAHSLTEILTKENVLELLEKAPVILPEKKHFLIETVESQYVHCHQATELEVARNVLLKKFPSFIPAFDTHMESSSLHICNMFIMQKPFFDEYCQWLFDVLFSIESLLDDMPTYKGKPRTFGFLGERLLDVWIRTKEVPYIETPVILLEPDSSPIFTRIARRLFYK